MIEDPIAIPDPWAEEAPLDPGPVSGQPADPVGARLGYAPDLIGLLAIEAHAAARSSGVYLSTLVWETRVGPWGMVVDQRPAAGSRMRRGGKLTVVVSGRRCVAVPDVSGLPLREAIEHLGWLGFVALVEARRTSHSVLPGHVISTRPASGELLPGGSVVALALERQTGAKSGAGGRAERAVSECSHTRLERADDRP